MSNIKSGEALQIEFYDADTLPNDIISMLALCLERSIALKIISYRGLLSHSLMRLGFTVNQVQTKHHHASLHTCRAIAIGGSANSLDKILHIIEHLPPSPMVIFIAQHVAEDEINLLDQLLRVRTDYQVCMPQHMCAIVPGTIYVAPPAHHMKIAHGYVYLTRDQKIRFARPSLDVLFESVAQEYGQHCLAILLCGFGDDGVAGCLTVKTKDACVIIENPSECGIANVLPETAQKTDNFDHIFKHHAITSLVASLVSSLAASPVNSSAAGPVTSPTALEPTQALEQGINRELIDLFLEALWDEYGYDLRGYQRDSLERRLLNLMHRFHLPHFCDFQRAIFSDFAQFMRLVAEISVGVTEFFRHPEQLKIIREQALPYLQSFPVIKIWSAGCATGEEAYSIAILLEELGLSSKSRLFATDINHYFLELAKAGLYSLTALESAQKNYHLSGGQHHFEQFVDNKKRYLQMRSDLCEVPLFYPHSLVNGGIFNEFQMIICRNVLIYFDAAMQAKILQQFARSLHRDGLLVLGPQDGLRHVALENGFTPYRDSIDIYRLQKGALHE
ncbi:CheR family methyltransferase [Undibacterium flavidum]|uniref:CheR family methyltransferase n=1 Tax=Undibacterium flavidum TaxID=2762297 RepID=UPI001C9B060B|nr:CheR family methyltransferase [Undibacterium flavidum]